MNRDQALEIIQSHLAQLDDESLVRLAQALEEGQPQPLTRGREAALSRRGFLKGILVMGLMGSVTTTGGTYLGWRTGRVAGRTETELRLSLEIARLRGLLALYETLEALGIEEAIERGIRAVGGALHAFDLGLNTLGDGLDLVARGLDKAEAFLDGLGDEVAWARDRLQAVLDLIRGLIDLAAGLLEPAERVGNVISAVADKFLGWLPSWAREPLTTVFDTVASVVEEVPEAVEGTLKRVIEPVQETLLPEGDNSLHAWVIRPLRERVLAPWQEQIAAWQNLLTRWDNELVQPVQSTIERRRQIRAQIAAYRQTIGNRTTAQDV